MRHLVDFPFEGAMVPLDLAIGLGVEGRGGNMPYPHQPQVFIELVGNIAAPYLPPCSLSAFVYNSHYLMAED